MTNKKFLVVIPYRNRENHLKEFIPYITNRLNQDKIRSTIVVVEQDYLELFNRGLLCNIGYIESIQNHHYVCFHDVDMICTSIDYSYSHIPLSLLRHRTKNTQMYKEYFGGITMFPSKIFKLINGFSNEYWGWGCEDDDLRLRCTKLKINVGYRNGDCRDLELISDNINRNNNPDYIKNLQKLRSFRQSQTNNWLKKDGILNTKLYYNIIEKIIDPHFIKIRTQVRRINE